MTSLEDARAPDFLAGGGEMGARMRALDWSKTPFGPTSSWPQSLRSAVSICLGTKFPIAIYWGSELALLYNDAWSSIPGEKHPWALGRPGREVWPEIWDAIGPLYEEVQTTGEGVWQQDQLLPMHRHGYTEECYFNFTFSPIRGEDGKAEGIFNAVVETTFRVTSERRERTLRQLAERIAAARSEDEAFVIAAEISAASAADVPFCLFYKSEPEGTLAHLVGIAGLGPESPARRDVIDLADDGAPWPLARVVATARPEIVDKLSSRFGVALSSGAWPEPVETALMVPIASVAPSGAFAGFLVLGVSPRRALDDDYHAFIERIAAHISAALANVRAYEEERKRAEALAEIDRAKTAFFSNVSHEFRTPLTLMLGPLEESLAAADRLLPDERERVQVVHRNGLRLLKLVNSLLDFSRIEAGRAQASFVPTDLAALTAELASNFRSATDRAGLKLVVSCPQLPKPVHVDHDMWEKIVLNLLSNAFKFTFEGEITVDLRSHDSAAVLTVRDTGTGIPAAELPRLFERFHRIEGAHGRSFEGSGIGLALVQELVRLHGGTILVDSEEGRGTAFTVSVPFGTGHLPPDRIRGARGSESTAVQAQAYVNEALRWLPGQTSVEEVSPVLAGGMPLPEGQPPRVILADDNADMRDYVARLLAGRHDVEAVADGEAALEAARRKRPDLVLTDIMMPRLDGFGLIRAIREDPSLRDLPIIVLSARAGEEASVEGLGAGADDYLVKPFSAYELIARVEGNLKLAKLRQEATAEIEASERRLRALVDASSDVVYRMNPDWSEMRQLVGRDFIADNQDPTRTGIEKYIHPDDQPRVVEAINEAIRTKSTFASEHRVRRVDGSLGWTFSRAIPLLNAQGDVSEWFGAASDITEHKRSEALRSAQNRVLELAIQQTSLADALDALVRTVEELSPSGMLGSILLLDDDGVHLRHGAGPNLPQAYNEAIDGIAVGPHVGSCGTAVHRREPVYVSDIATDPLWADFRTLALSHGLRACWSTPILSGLGEVMGTFAMYYREPREPNAADLELVDFVIRSASLVIEHKRAEEALRDLNTTLEQRINEALADQAKAEEQLRQAQKMEAVGKLTGGIAHDFNNLLQVIGGNLQLLTKDVAGSEKAEQRLRNALAGVSRGSKLASQLLAFGRRQPLAPKVVNLGRFARGMDDMLRRALGDGVEIETVVSGGLWNTLVDPYQVENALLNLAINARDAMKGHGKLTIEAGNASLDDRYAAGHDVIPGQYVMLAVTDTGSGIPPEIMEKVFEPFFTTKPEGRGTGLGLSMVYGFVKQSNGHIKIYSEPGEGTTIRIYLPRVRQAEDGATEIDAGPVVGGTETVLVVEDDEDVRSTVVEMLSDLGYRVLKANDAHGALVIVESGIPIDLLFTDVVMPGPLRSPEMARKARERLPTMAVLFTSGYTDNAIVHGGRLDEGIELLSKPYTREQLARKVRHVLRNKLQRFGQGTLSDATRREQLQAANGYSGPAQRVLLVEDDSLIRLSTADMLTGLGHTVFEAGSSAEALAILSEQTVDVLLTDVELPGPSGLDLAVEARRRSPRIKVVFASGQDAISKTGVEPGIPDALHVLKPYTESDLVEVLRPT